METTNTDFYPYQFKPVLRFLHSPSNALLIADEVGLGKTIEAGLIWTELRSRFDLRRLLVLCPAMLRDKWERELRHKIGVRADIVNAAQLLKRLRQPEANIHGYALICSLEGARPHRGWDHDVETDSSPTAELARYLRSRENDDHLIDMLIVDEAHYLRNPESQTNELGHLFRPVAEHLLLLTATPIHNYNRDLFTLLNLLDADTFERQENLQWILEASRPLVEARAHILAANPSVPKLEKILEQAESHSLLRGNRQLKATREALQKPACLCDRAARSKLAYRLEMINPLAYVISRTRKRDVKEWRVIREPVLEAVSMRPAEEAFYRAVTDSVIEYAMSRDVNEGFILTSPQRQMSSSMPASLRAWRQRRDNIDEVRAASRDIERKEEIGPLTRAIMERIDDFGSVEELMLHDSKYERVQFMVEEFFKENPKEKVVLFSTFRETLNYLGERLSSVGISHVVMHGGVQESKESILDRFRTDGSIRVLLSSEIGSEGIDLEFCRVLINYDLPWNPMRVEQRIGRLDRLGQQASKISIWNLLYAGTIDARIYRRLYEKLDLCRSALGDFEEILGDEIRKLEIDLLSDHLTPEQQEARIDQTAQALENLRKEEEQLEGEAAHLVAYGDYILNQVQAARELNRRIEGSDLRTYVIDFLRMHYSGCTIRQFQDDESRYEIKLSAAGKQDLEDFIRSRRLPTPTRLVQNASKPTVCRFENRTTSADAGAVELINQFHPVVRFVSAKIAEGEEQLTPAVSVALPASAVQGVELAPGDYVLAMERWLVEGIQLFEKLVFAAAQMTSPVKPLDTNVAERLANAAAQVGKDWFDAVHTVHVANAARIADDLLFSQLEEAFDSYVEDIRRQNEDRADLQLRNLQRHLENQRQKMIQVRERHRLRGRESLVKATEGRIQALEARVEGRQHAVESRRGIRHRRDELLAALIRLLPQPDSDPESVQ
jgi:SNF2 family DNA or RNA helicase